MPMLHRIKTTFLVALFIRVLPTTSSFAVGGGPPASVTKGGPPPGGPPGATGPPGAGGPPGTAGTNAPGGLETFFEKVWPILYAFDEEGKQSGVRDSSKNLRVLWTRALLNNLEKIEDPFAYDFLPDFTRNVVGMLAARTFWSGPLGKNAIDKLDWIVDRTNFIDTQLELFLGETKEQKSRRQVILLGAGYDTRSLRFQRPGLKFFEVDLPDISRAKESMMTKYSSTSTSMITPAYVGFDLNSICTDKKSLIEELVNKYGFSLEKNVPTMIICEAVLFYLIPDAAQGLMKEVFDLPNAERYCMTDNLAKLGVAPGPPVPTPREKCESWLDKEGKELIDHSAIWGGAIHFVAAK